MRGKGALALALALASPAALAQDAAAPAAADASVTAPGPVDPTAPLPPGHPPMQQVGDPHGGSRLHRAELPESFATEAPELPAGVVLVRVVDARGEPVPEAVVRVGAMRDGEPAGSQEVRTGPDGTARIERMATGSTAYRLSVEHQGARTGAPPFQLPPNAGYRVQLVRHDVTDSPRAVLIWDARAEIRFKDDRAVVVMRLKVVNLTAMALGEAAPTPTTFVPRDGLRFELAGGHTAFVAAPSMSDQHLTEEGGAVVLRGSIPPTANEPVDVVFQYQVKLTGGDVDLRMTMPLPVVSASVVTEAPAGLTLAVDGMPAPETRESEGQRVLITGLERRPDDPPLRELRVHLGGIPSSAGPMRLVASVAAALVALGALWHALTSRRRAAAKRDRAAVTAERDRVLEEMAELARLRREGEVGPSTYARRRRELARWLAALLRELDEPAGVYRAKGG